MNEQEIRNVCKNRQLNLVQYCQKKKKKLHDFIHSFMHNKFVSPSIKIHPQAVFKKKCTSIYDLLGSERV